MPNSAPTEVRLEDYTPPSFAVDSLSLHFDLHEDACVVVAESQLRRIEADAELVLDGDELELLEVAVDGRVLEAHEFELSEHALVIPRPPRAFSLRVRTRIHPQRNTALEGLYRSGNMFCTQCEAEGFRRITFFLDRPDVMTRYRTTIEADRTDYPVLLANGNLVEEGPVGLDRHYATWEDPFPKPTYLFALVAGNLRYHPGQFTTASGRQVDLRIYVEPHNIDRCAHAMQSLELAMAWDERVYGLEYDLDIFMIVAVDTFNMGAMENKGLNIFNSKYVLADPDTATDLDYHNIESIIAHEYFHNWTGNRVTCRDWFQLSLKEGLTVFRDQEFTADTRSRATARIADVRILRNLQFREDAGPTAHPVRPEAYAEINNFYTVTVYNKGAEVVRMIHRLLGSANFRAGMDLYFERHDGQAVTTDDFVAAMEDACGRDLSQFRRWYDQAGTPEISVQTHYDQGTKRFTLALSQTCAPTADGSAKAPFHIPVSVALIDPAPASPAVATVAPETTLELTEATQSFHFDAMEHEPLVSVLRGFSAPVRIRYERPDAELATLMRLDSDEFNRWEAGQTLAERLMLRALDEDSPDPNHPTQGEQQFIDALRATLGASEIDRALVAEMLTLPAPGYLADQLDEVDPDAIHAVRSRLRRLLGRSLGGELLAAYNACRSNAPYRFDTDAVASRTLKNIALGLLVDGGEAEAQALCLQQFEGADNMTDCLGALSALVDSDIAARADALATFERRWRHDPLVLDKWFSLQACSTHPGCLEAVQDLMSHPGFNLENPNRVRALVGAFCQRNPLRFHDPSGRGYDFAADQVIALDALNPQVAARLASAFLQWRKYDSGRRASMRRAMQRILDVPTLSTDCREILSKAVGE